MTIKETELDLLQVSLQGSQKCLKDLWQSKKGSRELSVVSSINRSHLRALMQETGKVSLPFIAFGLPSIEPNTQSFNTYALQRYGRVMGKTEDLDEVLIAHLTPILARVPVIFVTDNFQDYTKFSSLWLKHRENLGFDLRLDKTSAKIQIKSMGADQIAAPDFPLENDGGSMMLLETELALWTYVGHVERVPTIKSIELQIGVTSQDADYSALTNETVDTFSIQWVYEGVTATLTDDNETNE